MEKPDVTALAQRMIEAVRGFVARAEATLVSRIAEVEAKIAAIPAGPQGDKGDPGESIRGERGEKGDSGKDAAPEVAINGKDGKDGRDGRDGKDGLAGRDAAELDILPSIDKAKSYRRGQWASHNGGIVRAVRETEPLDAKSLDDAGWCVVVDPVADVTITQGEDLRSFTFVKRWTSGKAEEKTVSMPVIIDRGVWREGPHEKGDHVSWDGSGWIAQRDTTDKPGTSDAWRLSTKRGRDGKSAEIEPARKAEPVRLK